MQAHPFISLEGKWGDSQQRKLALQNPSNIQIMTLLYYRCYKIIKTDVTGLIISLKFDNLSDSSYGIYYFLCLITSVKISILSSHYIIIPLTRNSTVVNQP